VLDLHVLHIVMGAHGQTPSGKPPVYSVAVIRLR
jgi:hypothetical protein